jgi:hypothetical protein
MANPKGNLVVYSNTTPLHETQTGYFDNSILKAQWPSPIKHSIW